MLPVRPLVLLPTPLAPLRMLLAPPSKALPMLPPMPLLALLMPLPTPLLAPPMPLLALPPKPALLPRPRAKPCRMLPVRRPIPD